MERTIFVLLALFALPAAAQDWTTVPLGTTDDLHDIHHAGGGHGTGAVTGDGGFLATSPDNLTWTAQNVGTSADLFSLLGEEWVGGAAGTVRVKRFGVWEDRSISTGEDVVLSTQSSGEAIAYGSGGGIWKTINYGGTWTFVQNAGVPLHDGWGGTFVFGLAVGDNGTILKTTDSGATWTPRNSGTTADLYAVTGGGTGQYIVVGENGTILVSLDSGETWSPRLSGTTRTLRDVHAWGNARFVAGGDGGTLVRSSGNGDVWCRYDPGVTADFFAVQVSGLTLVQAAGEGGLFRQSMTGGGPCTPAVDATITRVGTNTIPASGGPLTFTVTLQNTTPEPQQFEAWVDAVIPGNVVFGPIVGPQTLTLNPGQTIGPVSFTQQVPANAPAGVHTVRLRAGAHPEALLLDESLFTFSKAASAPREGARPMTPADWGADGSLLAASSASAPLVGFAISDVFPNPLRDAAALTLTVARAQHVTAAVYDVQGRRVASSFEGEVAVGVPLDLTLDVRGLAPGVYVVRVQGETFAESRRLVVTR
jgi:hypothetical protein